VPHQSQDQHSDDRFDDKHEEDKTDNLRDIMDSRIKMYARPQKHEKYHDEEVSERFDPTGDLKSI